MDSSNDTMNRPVTPEFHQHTEVINHPPVPKDSPPKPDKKPSVKRKLDFSDLDKEGVVKEEKPEPKFKKYPPSVNLLLQPMLTLTIYLCKQCTQDSRKGAKTKLEDGKMGVQLVICDKCMEFNGDHRVKHLTEIAFPKKK